MRVEKRNELIVYLTAFAMMAIFTYGVYWVFKTISYELFYEDMVEQTVREMVKPEYLQEAYRK